MVSSEPSSLYHEKDAEIVLTASPEYLTALMQ